MEVIIHGTKGGYGKLYATVNAPSIARDLRDHVGNEDAIGKSMYSISMENGGYAFTKFIIVRDSIRSSATGTIAFTLYLNIDKKISGNDAVEILDKLSKTYSQEYIKDFNMNKGDSSQIHSEDWDFVQKILNDYEEVSFPNPETIQSGNSPAAYVYYNEIEELHRFFDSPIQVEYTRFERVFFISSGLKDKKENPLNVVKHSNDDLTNIVDLNNIKFYLKQYSCSNSLTISEKVNGEFQSRSPQTAIRKKSLIRLKYNKDNRYYEAIVVEGRLDDIEVQKYLVVENDYINVKCDVFKPIEKEKQIKLNIKDWKGEVVNDADIECNPSLQQKISNNIIKIKGEEAKKSYTIKAKIGDNMYSKSITFTPNQQSNDLRLEIDKHKKVKLLFDAKPISTINILVNGNIRNNGQSNFEIDFVNEEIDKKQKIKIKVSGYEDFTISFVPADNNEIIVPSTKKEDKSPGKKLSIFSLLSVILMVITSFGLVYYFGFIQDDGQESKQNTTQLTKEQVVKYVEGVELNLDALEDYKVKWKSQKPKEEVKNDSWLSIFDFSSDNNKGKSVVISREVWDKVLGHIERAITKRASVNEKDFIALKKLRYSDSQLKFNEAIKMIDSGRYESIKSDLGSVENLDLNSIAEKIDSILKVQNSSETTDNSVRQKVSKKTKKSAATKESIKTKKKKNPKLNKKEKEVAQSLKGEDISLKGLKDNKKELEGTNHKLIKSIDLYISFWDLDGADKRTYYSFYKKIKKDKYLQDSKLKEFVKKRIDEDSPTYPTEAGITSVGGGSKKTLKKLKNKTQ